MDFEGAGIAAARVVMLSRSDRRKRGVRCASDIETGRRPFVKDHRAGTKRIGSGLVFAHSEFAEVLRSLSTSTNINIGAKA
jgi:hypothetical protein